MGTRECVVDVTELLDLSELTLGVVDIDSCRLFLVGLAEIRHFSDISIDVVFNVGFSTLWPALAEDSIGFCVDLAGELVRCVLRARNAVFGDVLVDIVGVLFEFGVRGGA